MADAQKGLKDLRTERNAKLIGDDLDVLESHPQTSGQISDYYIADLAAKHGFKVATFDRGLKHAAVILLA